MASACGKGALACVFVGRRLPRKGAHAIFEGRRQACSIKAEASLRTLKLAMRSASSIQVLALAVVPRVLFARGQDFGGVNIRVDDVFIVPDLREDGSV